MTDLSVVQFPGGNVCDVPAALRNLAAAVEGGEISCTHLAWAIADGGNIITGCIGPSATRFMAAGMFLAAANQTISPQD